VTQANPYVVFEQPLTERVRTFLRLDFLFAQHRHHIADASEFGLRGSVHSLLDILTLLSRTDLKNDILKELSEQHIRFSRLARAPGVDQERLNGILVDLNQVLSELQTQASHPGHNLLRENDFLMSVLNRYAMPGGTCGFDLPGYHYWLSQLPELSHQDLSGWRTGLCPFERAISLYLRLLRESVPPAEACAQGGIYIHSPEVPCALLRVHVPQEACSYPEISAGRHRFTLRFMNACDVNTRSQQRMTDLHFLMQCCHL
jgi:cell division protein ZapD